MSSVPLSACPQVQDKVRFTSSWPVEPPIVHNSLLIIVFWCVLLINIFNFNNVCNFCVQCEMNVCGDKPTERTVT